MKNTILAVAVVFFVGACSSLSPIVNPTSSVDLAATSQANMQIAVAQTLTAQPSLTFPPPSDTLIPTLTVESTLSPTTIPPTTVVATNTIATGTFEVATSTNLPATLPVGPESITPTPGVLTYGTLPPAVPFSQVTLINRAKRDAYISLQVVTKEGGPTIIEYPVYGNVKFQAPTGHYLYVAWVGGREMIGEFRLHKGDDLTIILYKDRIEVK